MEKVEVMPQRAEAAPLHAEAVPLHAEVMPLQRVDQHPYQKVDIQQVKRLAQ